MKTLLKLFLLITAFASPCALTAGEVVTEGGFSKFEECAGCKKLGEIGKGFFEIVHLFDADNVTFEAIEAKLTTFCSHNKRDLLAYTSTQQTLLHILICNEKVGVDIKKKAIKLFVENGADINAEYGSCTPLFLAIKQKLSIEVFEALIENGAQVNKKINCQYDVTINCQNNVTIYSNITPLHEALDTNADPEIIELLLQNGAEVNALGKIENVQDPSQNRSETPLFIATRSKENKTTGGEKIIRDGKIIQLLLEYNADRSIICLYEGQEMTAQKYASSKLEMDESEIKALFATQPNTEKIKLIKKQVAPGNSSWSPSSKVGLTFAVVATGVGAYYLYTKYQEKKKRDQEDQKRKAAQERIEKLEKLEKEMVEQAKAKAKEVAIPTAV